MSSLLRLLLAGTLLCHQECRERPSLLVAHIPVGFGGPRAQDLRILQPVINPSRVEALAHLRESRPDVTFVFIRVHDMARLASILGIEKSSALLDLGG